MARLRSELAAQLFPPGKFSPSYTAESGQRENGSPRDKMASADMPKAREVKKVPFQTASYVQDGPDPFICRNCTFFDHADCSRVEGPYEGGKVAPEDSCRFFCAAEETQTDYYGDAKVPEGEASDDSEGSQTTPPADRPLTGSERAEKNLDRQPG